MLDFSVDNNISAVSNSLKQLDPYAIHTVKYVESKTDSFQGKSDPSKTFNVLRVRFSNEDGYYEETIFYPTSQDAERRTFENSDGTTREMASNWERTKFFMAQVMEVLNPDGYKKFCAASSQFKSFDDMANAFIKVLTPAVGKETKLKLMGRTDANGNVRPCLPSFVGVNREGKAFVSTNFIGDRVFFSTYEESKVQQFKNAKPTSMPELGAGPLGEFNAAVEPDKKKDTIDLDDLL